MKKYGLLITSLITTIVCMPVMVYLFLGNSVYAGDMKLDDGAPEYGSDVVNMTLEGESEIQVVEGLSPATPVSLGIPLDSEVKTDRISVFEDKAESLIRIRIPTRDKEFYYKNQLTGSQKGIDSLSFEHVDRAAEFDIHTEGYYIATVHMTPKVLYLELNTPNELYGHVYVIDASHGGEDRGNSAYGIVEKDLTLDIAKEISDMAASAGVGGVYLTRSTDEAISDEDREKLIGLLKPDVYLTLHVDADSSTRVTNGVRGVTNEEQGQINARGLISVLASETGQQDLGVTVEKAEPVEDRDQVKVNEIDIYTGYVTNKADALKMSEETYPATVAKVIFAWLMQEEQ